MIMETSRGTIVYGAKKLVDNDIFQVMAISFCGGYYKNSLCFDVEVYF